MALLPELLIDFVPRDAFLIYASISKAWYRLWRQRGFPTISNVDHFGYSASLIAQAADAAPSWIVSAVVKTGDMSLIEMMYEARPKVFHAGGMVARTFRWPSLAAASAGHLHVLQWMQEKGCYLAPAVADVAALSGHLHILRWDQCSAFRFNVKVLSNAAKGGHMHILQWANEKQKIRWSEMTSGMAAEGGHLDLLKWLHRRGCPCDWRVCAYAAAAGHLDVLDWGRGIGLQWDESTCAFAAGAGRLDMLRFLRTNGCPWDAKTCARAAAGGHLEVLRWARTNGCPWDTQTCIGAASCGHLSVLQWAYDNGAPLQQAMYHFQDKRTEVVDWLLEKRCAVHRLYTV